ncbi:hypothetical protein BB8028_0003g09380 [Beauveria bassiana]|uniref:LIM zinc-binding domain-containing protein n=1 Tax=Beauveria bassiana TaxID=176275 RepID=A0A2S7Y856_BEABA|nr:hypothetical protein BB8028_0003g09380 [Beauveria bassiana]
MSTKHVPALSFENNDESICDYCHCSTSGYPIILGHSARLACSQCASAIIKLSICWVCGEMICRGDDCISFGWCFWHRACYSCLLCGNREIIGTSTTRSVGTKAEASELLRPPLCAACDTETARDTNGVDDAELVQACVNFVDSADGGIAKLRWQMMSDRSIPDGRENEMRLLNQRQESGNMGESRELIWVNVVDPVNGPVFRPHLLKPVPICMTKSACKMR